MTRSPALPTATASTSSTPSTASQTTAPPEPPAASPRRLIALDVLRGIAILGTFLTNIWIFSMVEQAGGVDRFVRGETGVPNPGDATAPASALAQLNPVISGALNLVTDGKFIGLLTIMFGIGLEIQRQSALRRGERWPGRYPWRAGLLILDGLLNYIFIFTFDVLMGYGLTALVVAAIMATSPRAQKIWMTVGIVAHLGFMALTVPAIAERLPWLGTVELTERRTSDGLAGTDRLAEAVADPQATYWGGVVSRVTDFWNGRSEIPIMVLMGLGLFLVGAHLYRAGIFEERGRTLRLRVMALSFGLGLPIDWTLRLMFATESGSITRYVTSSMVSFGLLALVAHFYVGRTRTGLVGTALSYVGRMALTCYIGQNLLASIVFLPWGLNLTEHIEGEGGTLWTLAIYVALSGVLILFSMLWLRRFSRGPVELAWHASYEWICARLDSRARRRQLTTRDPAPSV